MDRNTLYIYIYVNSINFAVARVSNLQQGQQQGTSTMFLLPHLRIMCDRETGAAGFFVFFFSHIYIMIIILIVVRFPLSLSSPGSAV